ncbi:MAG TPA: SulP family inorganic anion transporter, partial [Cyclobacteriaceae bacterium]
FLVALPLCLGIALASGAPLFAGIITGIVGGIVVGLLSKSPLSVSGPAAGLTTIVLAAIIDLGFEAFLVAVILAGAIQIIAGFLRAGTIGHFFPASVLRGMLAAIGVILILKQIPHAVGYDVDFEGDQSFFQNDGKNTLTELLESWDYLTPGAIAVSVFSVLVLVLWSRNSLQRYQFFKVVPSALAAVAGGILLNALFIKFFPDLIITEKHLVNVPTLAEEGSYLAFFTFPDFSQIVNTKVWIVAFTIAAVASLETLLNIEACDKIDPFRRITPLNRELKAQGVANLLSGAIGGLPLTSVVVRSSANIQAGARTKASAITHGVILLLSVLLIPRLLQLIPLSALAGILFVTGFKLTKPEIYKEMYKKGWSQFLPFIATVLAVVFTNLLLGVFIGILVAVFFILKTNFQESVILVNEDNNFLLRLTKDVSFLNKATLRDVFIKIPSNSTITIDGSQSHFIDHDVKETIGDFIETSKARNIEVHLKNIEV